jgi:hypothetical protein
MWVRPILMTVSPCVRFGRDGVAQGGDRRHEALLHVDRGGDIHGRREGIVRRLRHVDVVVGMHGRFAAERRAGQLAAAIRDHLVHVHVELRAASRHPHMQREHVGVRSGEDFVARLGDEAELLSGSRPSA